LLCYYLVYGKIFHIIGIYHIFRKMLNNGMKGDKMKLQKWDKHYTNEHKLVNSFKFKIITKGGENTMETLVRENTIECTKRDFLPNSFLTGMKEVSQMERGLKPKRNARDLVKQLRELENSK
jgi:hypothetical protein